MRLYWGANGAECPECYRRWLMRGLDNVGTTVVDFFKDAPVCLDCADTRRDPVPWTELFRVQRRHSNH